MNESLPSPLCLQTLCCSPTSIYSSFHPSQAASMHSFHSSHPPLTPGFDGLCYDCDWYVLHTDLSAPLLCRDDHIKDCHFQRSGVSPAHKCCLDTWYGKIKTSCSPVLVHVCGGYDSQRQVAQMSFLFSPIPPYLLLFCASSIVV